MERCEDLLYRTAKLRLALLLADGNPGRDRRAGRQWLAHHRRQSDVIVQREMVGRKPVRHDMEDAHGVPAETQ